MQQSGLDGDNTSKLSQLANTRSRRCQPLRLTRTDSSILLHRISLPHPASLTTPQTARTVQRAISPRWYRSIVIIDPREKSHHIYCQEEPRMLAASQSRKGQTTLEFLHQLNLACTRFRPRLDSSAFRGARERAREERLA